MKPGEAAGRVARVALGLLPSGLVVPIVAGPLRGIKWVVGSAPHGAWLGQLEREVLADFVRHVRPGGVVADVGANVGLYTLAAARAAGGAGRIVAFEPVPQNARALRRHLALNAVANVDVIEAAVSTRAGELRMSAGDSPSEFHIDGDGSLAVRAVDLDSWWREHALPAPDIVKIDVEGAEADVLRSASELIASSRPRVYLAVHGDEAARACRAFLERHGYRLTTADGRRWPFEASEWIGVP